jgi:hypothetical protein
MAQALTATTATAVVLSLSVSHVIAISMLKSVGIASLTCVALQKVRNSG